MDVPAGLSDQNVAHYHTCYNQLSPRLQSSFLDAACLLDGVELEAIMSLWAPDGDDDLKTLCALSLLDAHRHSPDQPWCLRVQPAAKEFAAGLVEQMWIRRAAGDDALALLETSKVSCCVIPMQTVLVLLFSGQLSGLCAVNVPVIHLCPHCCPVVACCHLLHGYA